MIAVIALALGIIFLAPYIAGIIVLAVIIKINLPEIKESLEDLFDKPLDKD